MYGWGWTPITWQGWVLTLIYALGLIPNIIEANKQHSGSDFLVAFAIPFITNTILFLVICYSRGERPRWRWGGK